jgi:hypothetical protein
MFDRMKWGRLVAPAVLAFALPGAALAADCAEFEGIQHCATGSAKLSTTSSGLEVTGFDGQSGVAIQLGGATHWQIGTAFKGNSAGNAGFVSTAVAGGQVTSTMRFQQQGSQFGVTATFTGAGSGSTYAAMVYNNGVFQGGQGNIPSGSRAMIVNRYDNPLDPWVDPWDPWWDPWWWPWWWWHDIGFGLVASNGGCFHSFGTSEPVTFTLPDGREVVGNRVELVEEVRGSGSYPYLSFDAMRLTGTIESLTIESETVQR